MEEADGGDSVVKIEEGFSKVVSITSRKIAIVQRLTKIDDGEFGCEIQVTENS